MSRGGSGRAVRAILIAVPAALFAALLWRAFGARPGGRFPLLEDVPIVLHKPGGKDKVRSALRASLKEAAPASARPGDPKVAFLVDLPEQVDFYNFGLILDERGLKENKSARRTAFLEALRLVAHEYQAAVVGKLERLREAGRIERWDAFRIANRISVVASDPGVVTEIAGWREVAQLVEATEPGVPRPRSLEGPQARKPDPQPSVIVTRPKTSTRPPADPLCWALPAIGAPDAWARGLDGRGVVVGLLDTGASASHNQLAKNWRGARDPRLAARSWYHPFSSDIKVPHDSSWHGTGVLSTAVAQNVPLGDGRRTMIGAAPGATWVAAVAYPEDRPDRLAFTAAAEWMLFSAKPDIVVHSYTQSADRIDPMIERMFNAFKVAETVVVFSAGNSGPQPGLNNSPAHFPVMSPWAVPAFSIGATGRDGQVAEFSARGPSSRDYTTLFPQIVAPGVDVTVAFPLFPDALIGTEGTSFSVGYAAGAAAILLQAAPDLRPNAVEHLLKSSARPVGQPHPSNSAGWGLLDIPAALKKVDQKHKPPARSWF